jgi:hypothetical protein
LISFFVFISNSFFVSTASPSTLISFTSTFGSAKCVYIEMFRKS